MSLEPFPGFEQWFRWSGYILPVVIAAPFVAPLAQFVVCNDVLLVRLGVAAAAAAAAAAAPDREKRYAHLGEINVLPAVDRFACVASDAGVLAAVSSAADAEADADVDANTEPVYELDPLRTIQTDLVNLMIVDNYHFQSQLTEG